jgi:putative SOS response-associated peptidase YedK
MCGRFTLTVTPETLAHLFRLLEAALPRPRYNIAPTQAVAVVRQAPDQPGRVLDFMRWGLIPPWAEDARIGNRLINARSETVAEKPAFRSAFRRKRCLIPADSFFEWKKENGKQPYCIRLKDGAPFAFAGLWESWKNPEGQIVESCTLLTTTANEVVRPIHERMPVILEPAVYDTWLDPAVQKPEELKPLLGPFAAKDMMAFPVGRWVNDPKHDDPKCLEPEKP